MLHIEHLYRIESSHRAILDDIHFSFSKSILAILGQNGSGKSTLLKILSGVLPPCRGAVSYWGVTPYSFRQFIGYVPEDNFLPPFLRVGEYLYLIARLYSLPFAIAKQRIDYLTKEFFLAGYERKLIRHLSCGTLRKVLVAQAFLAEPRVLLLDEPSVYLDAETKTVLYRRLQAIRERTLIVLSSHVFSEIEHLADTAVILQGGKVFQVVSSEAMAVNPEWPNLFLNKPIDF